MNFNSIITKIIFVFSISIVLFVAVFISYYQYEQKQLHKKINDNYVKITRYMHDNRLPPYKIVKYIKQFNFEVIEKPKLIVENNDIIGSGPGFGIYEYKNSFYINIHAPDFRMLAKDLDSYSINYTGFLILGIIFVIYILSFLWIIKSLKPLKILKEQIQEFSNGNLSISCKSDKKDEIADVANEFDNAVQKISLLLNSRQLFLRTVMHELKTPIAKGRIVSELINDDKQKNRMINIFDKLNLQINDFSRIEEIVSQNYSINKYPISLNKIVEEAAAMMMLDNPKNKISSDTISNKNIKVDLDLFSLAIKNLLDNGIKYSTNKKVEIQENKESINIISLGEKLQKPLEEYFIAYHNDTKSKNHGMGLGLYIVHEILKMHSMQLNYEYKEGQNIFKIIL